MDASLQQQSHRFMRPPPPPPMADPQHQQRPPPQPQNPWYSTHFQYQPSQPPPHHPSLWTPPSSSSYPTPQPNPYPAHPPQHHYQFPPPPPPPPPSYSHPPPPQAYPQPNHNQTLGNPNWAHHQGWEHPERIPNNNEEDWAARARAWASAKAAMENQHPQSQFTHIGRPEEHSHIYHDQYQHVADPRYTDTMSSHQQFPSSANPHFTPVNHLQESTSFNSGPSHYVSDVSFNARDGVLAEDSNPVFPHQGRILNNSSVYQQEVPSSYSSVPGREEFGPQTEQLHNSSPLPISSAQEGQHHVQSMPSSARSVYMEQPHFTHGDHHAERMTDLSDRPLEFAPGFSRNHDSHDPHSQVNYMHHGPAGSMDPITALTPPVGPSTVYPPIPPVPSGLQFDPSFAVPPVPGHSLPMFGQIPGPSFRPTIPTVSATFGLGVGTALHPTTAFPGDANGVSNVSERPKKASVPNWLREEIIKKAVFTSSSQEYPEEDPNNPMEDDGVEKSFMKGATTDGKSIDSYRSSDDDDDDEDDIAAARTAAINQEIKRVLTEVLLKVTDELFDEIATKVLSEDDPRVEVDQNNSPQNYKVIPSTPPVLTPKASAKVLIPIKAKETVPNDASEESTSGSPGDVLGLASYVSDDNDDEIQSSKMTTRQTNAADLHVRNYNISEDIPPKAVEDGSSQAKIKGSSGGQTNVERDHKTTDTGDASHDPSVVDKGETDDRVDKDLNYENDILENKINVDGGKMVEATDAFVSKDAVGVKTYMKPELPHKDVISKKLVIDDSQGRVAKSKSDKNVEQSSKRSSSKDFVKETEVGSGDTSRRHEEKHARREKIDDRNGLQEKVKDRGSKHGEKAKKSDSVKSHGSKDDKRESGRAKKDSAKDDSNRKRERGREEKGDRSRHRASTRDSSRHKRRRSSSVGSRDRNGKDDESSDEASEDSRRRRPHSTKRKQSLSPSPTRSRRRQVTRSPRSQHSQRRHSPYSSLERKRG